MDGVEPRRLAAVACGAAPAAPGHRPVGGRPQPALPGRGHREARAAARASRGAERRAALALAQKRRFGPFGTGLPDRPMREKQLAAMLRAGHPLDSARELVNAADVAAALEWAEQGDDE